MTRVFVPLSHFAQHCTCICVDDGVFVPPLDLYTLSCLHFHRQRGVYASVGQYASTYAVLRHRRVMQQQHWMLGLI
ncbi:hypothetical protein Taro_031668 [Colocasia esculenta]|uniref:Uncharacterized protein n=1 Tax=Colocasia esculenta TaxID=4460 RepID=A0A843VJD7_COLES|nr:hypothetical protein [Colocasia esculenta]